MKGFSLTEVLISLLIISSLSLQLLYLNWQVSKQFNRSYEHSQQIIATHNKRTSLKHR